MGRPPDRFPHESEAVWQLTEGALLYVVTDPERAGRSLLTLIVDDLDGVIEELTGSGMAPGRIETLPGRVRKITFEDPDGNRIALGEVG